MTRGLRLPDRVMLPSAPIMSSATARLCLSASKQRLHGWRAHGFPVAHRDGRERFYLVADVERWLIANGVGVRRE